MVTLVNFFQDQIKVNKEKIIKFSFNNIKNKFKLYKESLMIGNKNILIFKKKKIQKFKN